MVKLLADPVAYVSCQAAATLGNWDQKETAVPALVKLLEAPNANMRYRAAELLGKWGLQESAVTAFVLKQLAGKADPAVMTLLHQSGPATGKRVSGEARANLAALLHPQNNDSTEVSNCEAFFMAGSGGPSQPPRHKGLPKDRSGENFATFQTIVPSVT